MNVIETKIPGLLIIEPKVFGDERGFFVETYNEPRYKEMGISGDFVQDNLSKSKKGVLRGLHYQAPPFDQGKLVTVLSGAVLDVAVDIRFGSPTFGQYVAVELTAENKKQFWIPAGFAHGFVTLEDDTVFAYKCTNVYSPEHDRGVKYDDPAIGIEWPEVGELTISEKDQNQPMLKDITEEFIYAE
ncbi:MAG: dTDP-4-dehydrorhamnose 3,5-epimerase [Candidatus Moranbacteria bacterium]|nr:dTDP-4-dehydrorhamnose 3,5-epimerase [Candidatus Moranbacteria bacterium]